MIVIGVDVHKRTHTLVAIDSQTGRQLHQRTVQATDAGHLDALRFAHGLEEEQVLGRSRTVAMSHNASNKHCSAPANASSGSRPR